MDPDINDCKVYEFEEIKNQQEKQELMALEEINQKMKNINSFQNSLDLLIQNQHEDLDLVQDNTQGIQNQTQESKDQVNSAMDQTLSLRTNKLTIAFSGALGALTMIKGFGVTIGAALGGMLGRKIGKISEGDIREKANK